MHQLYMAEKVFKKGLPRSLKQEIKDSLNFLAETDIKLYGKVTPETKQAFETQKVKLDSKKVLMALKKQQSRGYY